MKLIKLSNFIFLSSGDLNIEEFSDLIEMILNPELRKAAEEENLIHDLYLEDFLDAENY
jgi:hypothetical protein